MNRGNAQESLLEVTNDVEEEGVIGQNYQGVHEARSRVNVGSCRLPEDNTSRQLSMRAFVDEPSVLFIQEAPVAQFTGQRE